MRQGRARQAGARGGAVLRAGAARIAALLSRVPVATRFAVAGALALALAIAANAMIGQKARAPETMIFATRPGGPPPDAAIVEAIQKALRDQALYDGPIDGIAGKGTAQAIRAFERASGRAETGVAERDLLEDLLAAADDVAEEAEDEAGDEAGPIQAAPDQGAPIPVAIDAATIALVQAALGPSYGPLDVDGVMGRRTREAVRAFQAAEGLPMTGEIDAALLARLPAAETTPVGGVEAAPDAIGRLTAR